MGESVGESVGPSVGADVGIFDGDFDGLSVIFSSTPVPTVGLSVQMSIVGLMVMP